MKWQHWEDLVLFTSTEKNDTHIGKRFSSLNSSKQHFLKAGSKEPVPRTFWFSKSGIGFRNLQLYKAFPLHSWASEHTAFKILIVICWRREEIVLISSQRNMMQAHKKCNVNNIYQVHILHNEIKRTNNPRGNIQYYIMWWDNTWMESIRNDSKYNTKMTCT